MAILNENSPSQLEAALDAGLDVLDRNESVTFTQYTKYVFSEDGYVFWVANPSVTVMVNGSLHYGSERVQEEDQTIGRNDIIFASEQEVTEFNFIIPGTMWIGTWPVADDTVNLQIAFSSRGHFYSSAQIWHYQGFSVYPALLAQLVASVDDLPIGPIVSNSLPIWLSQNGVAPVYPSFLVPDNAAPPYIVAHIQEGRTEAIQQFPLYIWPGNPTGGAGSDALGTSPLGGDPLANLVNLSCDQLMRDYVTLTLYGFTNQMAVKYLVSLIEFSLTEAFGFGNSPAIQDAKRIQSEIAAIAQKKTIEIWANYYQSAADVIARRLILSAAASAVPVLAFESSNITIGFGTSPLGTAPLGT